MSLVGGVRINSSALGGGAYVVAVDGELDLGAAPALSERLSAVLDEGAQSLVVDLGGVSFMDSAGLATLIYAGKKLLARGGRLALVTDDPNIQKLLAITGVGRLFRLEQSRTEAVLALADARA